MRAVGAWLFLVYFLVTGSAAAQDINLPTVTLTTNIVPRPNSSATGTANLALNASTRQLTWQIVVDGMAAAPTGIALEHTGAAVLQPAIALTPSGTTELCGSVTLTAAAAAELMAGRYALVLRTAANPNGELRGFVPPSR